FGFVVVALTTFAWQPHAAGGGLFRTILVSGLVIVWGARLSLHIFLRQRGAMAEDKRYRAMRESWKGSEALNAYSRIFLVQGLSLLVIVIPVIWTNTLSSSPLNLLDLIGAAVWLFGFLFETVGDFQLRRFIKNPKNKGKLMTGGLWRYTRHPNYFGEITQWWGIFIIALSVPFGWVSIIGPLMISFLIIKVSGVPLLEKKYAGDKTWEAYKKRTSMLIPLPPRRS
ncbi:MAG TPA: DUF1295 domain-containing protein, partial [Candidatus Saccharimonadales bacterium]|nr:DUF1295 domain-containing protein [Candidatus Saccharimonadales bacterium]